ncbi:MAG: TIM-barrel domain-containing protein, partial [bacterium]
VKHHWTWDPALYPNLAEQIAALRAKGVRFLGYFNPFIVEDYDQFAEAKEKGYMVKKRNGEPYVVQIITFKGGMLDVTNPDAVEWFKGFARKATDMGMSGWMCDFGEWLPYDAVLYDGTTGAALHNLYTTRWHRINREVLNEKYPDGDYALLTRSGYTFEQNVAQFVWAGDQEQDWKDEDGLPTVVTAALNIGLSGVPYFTTDIAGFSGGPSSKELFMRWTELGAFMPAMRTHDGLKKMENHRFDSDAETLAHFSKMAQIHAALLPYLKQVAGEAVGAGLPMIRHTVLVDPDWDKSLAANRQWLLGSDLLFAPALAQGAGSVEVSFPQGDWEHLLTGEKFKGRQTAIVAAPVGTPAVFVRSGKLDDVARAARAVYEK